MPVIEISSLSHPGVEMFCTLTEAQLRKNPRLRMKKTVCYIFQKLCGSVKGEAGKKLRWWQARSIP